MASVSGPRRPTNIITMMRTLPTGEKKAERLTGAPFSPMLRPTVPKADVVSKSVFSRSRPSVSSSTQATEFIVTNAMSETKNALATSSGASRRL